MTSEMMPDQTAVPLTCNTCGLEIKMPGQWVMFSGYPYHQQCLIPPVWKADRPAPATQAEIVAAAEAWVNAAMESSGRYEIDLGKHIALIGKANQARANFLALVAAHEAEVERLQKVDAIARELAMVWQHWKISGLPRSHRNAMIDDLRKQLFEAFPESPAAALRRMVTGG